MKTTQIDSLNGIDVSKLTFSDIHIMYNTGRSILLSGIGRDKKYIYRVGCQTKIGDIQKDIWAKLAEQLIKQSNEEYLLERLIKHVKEIPWMTKKSTAEIREKALDLHMSQIFDNPAWVNYIFFNESWRPDILESVDIVNVIPACCKKESRVTLAQIEDINDKIICCPHCGRFGTFQRLTPYNCVYCL